MRCSPWPAGCSSFHGSSASAELDAECGAPCVIHVSFYGTGSGQIVATWQEDGPKKVACRVDCIVSTDFGVVITFRATPDPESFFTSMVGDGCET